MYNARATAWPRSKGFFVVWPWYPSEPAWVSVLRASDDPCSHLDSPVPESLYPTHPGSHSPTPIHLWLCVGPSSSVPETSPAIKGHWHPLGARPCAGQHWAPNPGPALEDLSRFRWRWRCDNPGDQRRDTAPGYIWHCKKRGPTWRPWDGCLELIELTGKVGRELQADRKNAESHAVGMSGLGSGKAIHILHSK